jgi:diketogulonate reductase-like aldo/keto reductase
MPGSPADTLTAHGAAIPVIGFGTSGLRLTSGTGFDAKPVSTPAERTLDWGEIVATALAAGYRHIDTARKYGSERGVGEGIRAARVPRAEIFVTTKVSHEHLRADDFARSVDASLQSLGLDYVDLLLVHWPNPQIPLREPMVALAKAKREGLARHLGVANFTIALLDEALALCPEPLVTDQVEHHPYLDQSKIREACHRRGLLLTAHCPLGRGRLIDDPLLSSIAKRKAKSAAQVALRWALQHGNVVPIPRSSNPQRIAENLDIFDFALNDEEMRQIAGLARPGSRIADPAGRAPAWDA